MNTRSIPVRCLLAFGLLCVRLAVADDPFPGDLDPAFRLDPSLPPAAQVLAAAAHPDGRLLAVLEFPTGPELVALNPDGSRDGRFARRPLPGFPPRQLKVLADGRILTAYRPTEAPTNTSRVIRLSALGEVDPAFAVTFSTPGINCLAPMSDGSLMVGAVITNDTATVVDDYLHRILPDGQFDSSFAQGGSFPRLGSVGAVLAQGDGYVVLGGGALYRLDRSGQRDETFATSFESADAVTMLPNGKLLAAGRSLNPADRSVRWLLRLNSDGSVDGGFPPVPIRGIADNLEVRADGSCLVGGNFAGIGGLHRSGLALILGDGRVDASFRADLGTELPGGMVFVDLLVRSLGELNDGRTFVAGRFVGVGDSASGTPLAVLAKVPAPTQPVIASLPDRIEVIEGHVLDIEPRLNVPADSTFSWTRGGVVQGVLSELHLRNVQLRDSGPYRFTVTSAGGTISRDIAVKVVGGPSHPGSLDVSFGSPPELPAVVRAPRLDGLPANQRPPVAVATTRDGQVLLGGAFADYGYPGQSYLVRLNPDGTVDQTFQFNPKLASSTQVLQVIAVRSLPDGKVLAVAQTSRSLFGGSGPLDADNGAVFRLLSNGGLDPTFGSNGIVVVGRNVWAMDVDSAGRIIILHRPQFGSPTALRLLPDGATDAAFKAPAFESTGLAVLWHLGLLPDGGMYVGGVFNTVGGQPRRNLARLNSDGSLDTVFVPQPGLFPSVSGMIALTNGRVLVGNQPSPSGGPIPAGLVRLLADGALDPTFQVVGPATNGVYRIGLDAAGRILAVFSEGATLTDLAVQMVRLLPDGAADPEFLFAPGRIWLQVNTLSFSNDSAGQVLLAGDLWQPDGLRRHSVIRLNSNDERRITPWYLADGRAQLGINSRLGRTYVVERSPTLSPAQWSVLTRLNGTGELLQWTASSSESDGFFRVSIE
ncbi:MAG: hypothetical protein J0M24_04260 [Verrucomicrobia bacterium]|nr:hypothetical protein [Verrucomicrobiota bacterium]